MLQKVAANQSFKSIESTVSENGVMPFITFEDTDNYKVVLNLLGCKPNDIFIDVDKNNNEIGIYADKKGYISRDVSFLVFGVPSDAQIERISMKYKGGGLEVTIPRSTTALPRPTRTHYFEGEGIVA